MNPSLSLSRRDMVKFMATSPLLFATRSSAAELAAFTPTEALPDVSLQTIGLPAGTQIPVASNHEYWELYPTADTLSIERIERLPTGVGLRFTLAGSNFPLTKLTVEAEGDATVATKGRSFTIRFAKEVSLVAQTQRVDLHGYTADGQKSPPYFLNLQYNSNAQDAAAGRTMFSRIGVRHTNLQLAYSFVDDWIIENPTTADREYAQERWGNLAAQDAPPYQQARAITRRLIEEFEPRRGTPSDAMDGLHPFRQYERLLAEQDRCWCANMVEIMSLALNALDIPCRLVRMRHTYFNAEPGQPGKDFELMLAGGHTIAEVYDKTLGQWIFIDPTLRRLGIRDAAGEYLNFFEIHLQVNQPHRAIGLTLDAYDPVTKTDSVETFAESAIHDNVAHFARREQRFYYFKRG
ncbi:MAG: transglutaminase domain-containing protein [Opitutaceae bacterium]|jgi:hypothetical protein|nr:transglutaminase domain-containing protein [Opitutaceae bacterium]